jgi:hypothetical protein
MVVASAILTVAAGFHVYWGLGGGLGRSVSLPQNEDGTPIMAMPALGAHAVALALGAAIVLVLAYGGVVALPVPHAWLRIGMVALAVAFAARALSWSRYVGWFKQLRSTRFARYDTHLFSPLCLAVSLSAVAMLLAGR